LPSSDNDDSPLYTLEIPPEILVLINRCLINKQTARNRRKDYESWFKNAQIATFQPLCATLVIYLDVVKPKNGFFSIKARTYKCDGL
jgi:hypothetical protein